MEIFALFLALVVGLALGAVIGVFWIRSRPAHLEGMLDQAELMQGLDRLSDQMHHLDRARAQWQGQFHAQVDQLQRETRSLSTALRRPQVRGRWGELHLRRAVELAGLVDRCDFTEQVRLESGQLRPDLVVHLAGGHQVVVDAKVPLEAHLDATSTDDPAERHHHFDRHARQLRGHIDLLSSKAYWRALPESPEFVVLFMPAESFLAAALETDPSLIEYAATRQVVLATPTTLIALLRTVAHGWVHETLAEEAREVHRLGRELHQRLATFDGHLDALGRSLNASVTRYNQAVGSLESRVLVTARRFRDLGVTDDELPTPQPVALHAVRRAAGHSEADDPTVAL
ncbi:DNA recombination protein RmuC [Nocardioides sp. BP30]|uniref:DNA recombination protein RmuC n=1 Tax=Nocardioides sp. BP30 TaxID=3036374 RepID=UPI002469C3C3|nr:DNA recombination protein RmuC [Nocardioides sp. BP30]WGL53416.1 DNA recombination protein RmuC [Nocardioides sp. BP30]